MRKSRSILVIGKMPNSEEWQEELEGHLRSVGLPLSDISFEDVIPERIFDAVSNRQLKEFKPRIDAIIEGLAPDFILLLGNEALYAVLGKSGITKYRGRNFISTRAGKDVLVLPTISPSAIKRNPGQRGGFMADLRLFARLTKGETTEIPQPHYATVDTVKKIKAVKELLRHATEIDFDVETVGEYYDPEGRLISFAATVEAVVDEKPRLFSFALPLYHPESPWKRKHRSVMLAFKEELEAIPKVVAHNGSYDAKWMLQYGIELIPTFDTLVAQGVLDENVPKGLKVMAPARLGVEPWGVDTRDLLNMPIAEVLEYNVLDTWYMYYCRRQLKKELSEQPRLARLYKLELMPALRELVYSEMRGIWIDVPLLQKRIPECQAKLKEIEDSIVEAANLPIPEDGPDPWIDTEWPKDAKGKPRPINFNASIFAKWMLFEWLELPVIERGKAKDDGSLGDPSMAEDVLLAIKDDHPVVPLMLDRVQWQKYHSSFLTPYNELYDENHRIHTNFKLAGTVTGRLSSGKADAEKVTGNRGKMRGVNLQQVPRDTFIRGLFGAAPGWTFVEADYSQVELRIAAFLAREMTMIQLYQQGADIHTTTAARVAGIPESQVPKEVRKKLGKPVNFGFLYGMGWAKFISTAFSNYGSTFTEAEAKAARKTYFQLYPGLLPWHERMRRLVNQYGRVQSPFGRIRHLPDIYSPDQGVRAEAERQAINSPVQGMASDMAVMAMIEINTTFRRLDIPAYCLGLVHDAINYEVRDDAVGRALPIIKDGMENLDRIRRQFGVHIDVPIIADLAVGQHWGEKKELTADQVYAWDPALKGA